MTTTWEQDLAGLRAARDRGRERLAAAARAEEGVAPTALSVALEQVPAVRRRETPSDYPCRGGCGLTLPFPGACPACLVTYQRRARIEAIADAAATIPSIEAFRRASLTSPDLVAAVRPDDIETAVRLFDEVTTLSIIGGSLTCKSLLACALFRRVLRAGVSGDEAAFAFARGARFVPALELEDRFGVAMGATLLVLDDLGAELTSCPPGSPLAAQRIERSVKVIHGRHNAGLKTLITMGMPLDRTTEVYGAGVLGRIGEGRRSAAYVDLGGAS